ncbi:MAG: response regulator [candidate division Zixibacteria bacterium]|nr:response regulator [candidate division Zixibacteria bacterium]
MSSKSNFKTQTSGRQAGLTRNSTDRQALNRIGSGQANQTESRVSRKSAMETDVWQSTSGDASHILVVDDEEYICEVIKEMLADENYHVQMACDPQKAMDILEREPVDFVLTDLIMGEKSGVDVLNKTMKLYPDAVVVLMTGRPTIENAVAVLKSGAYDYLIKPFSMDTLRVVVKRGLEKQRLLRENINLKETVSLYRISEAMGSTIRLDFLLNLILETAIKELETDMAWVLLLEEKTNKLILKASLGIPPQMLKSGFLSGKDSISRWVIKNAKPQIFDKDEVEDRFLPREFKKKIRSGISHPLMAKGKVIGIVTLIRTDHHLSPFTTGQLHSLSIIASKAASAIENSKLYEELRESYMETLTALANAVEARDIYTRGHTERVWYMAELLARQMGWDEDKLWEVKMGGILHDIGKIGVPDAILNKPEALTQKEFEIMKQHPACGARILEGISFSKPAIPYVLYHHERFDGKGYPYGLRGEEIPIQGRLMAVVDTFDAITSDRPYRRSKGFELAVKEIKECSGTQFDPKVAKIFVEAWEHGRIDKERLKIKK